MSCMTPSRWPRGSNQAIWPVSAFLDNYFPMSEHAPLHFMPYAGGRLGPICPHMGKALVLWPQGQFTVPATVLVIDDSEEDLKYWSDALRQFSSRYTVLESANAADALNLCASRPIDCVVLDLDMPESGFHVLLELVPDRRLPKVPVIVLTHLPHPNLFEMAKHNGAQACLLKQSTSAQDLDQAIQQAMAAVQAARSAS